MEKFYLLTEEQEKKVVAGRKESESRHLRLCEEPTTVKKIGALQPLLPLPFDKKGQGLYNSKKYNTKFGVIIT